MKQFTKAQIDYASTQAHEENMVLENERWKKAQEERYYPNIVESLVHFFGKHLYYEASSFLICGKTK